MENLILILHIVICLLLMVLVLLQSGKEGMGVIFGGGSSSLFGSTGAGGMLAKLTAFMAVIFLVTSLSYNVISSRDRHKAEDIVVNVPIDAPEPPVQVPPAGGNATVPQ